ncbi:MAG: cupredoxin domain-containing protein [Acidimicrobiales bacterium]
MPTFRRLLPASVVGLALVLPGCGGSPESRRQIAVVSGPPAAFEPTVVTVNKDDNVIMAVGNSTTAVHGFTVEGYGIRTEIPPGGSEVKIKATHPGTFKVYCQLHETHQVATLVVQ